VGKKNTEKIDELAAAITTLGSAGETKRFLRDLLTEQELAEFGNRWKTARMLSDGVPYSVIEKETGMSSTTIARVSKWLTGGQGGYQFMIKKLSAQKHHPQTLRKKGLG
jgi:TrpR-related protein YerC/YecD